MKDGTPTLKGFKTIEDISPMFDNRIHNYVIKGWTLHGDVVHIPVGSEKVLHVQTIVRYGE